MNLLNRNLMIPILLDLPQQIDSNTTIDKNNLELHTSLCNYSTALDEDSVYRINFKNFSNADTINELPIFNSSSNDFNIDFDNIHLISTELNDVYTDEYDFNIKLPKKEVFKTNVRIKKVSKYKPKPFI